jgi:N-acyl homoserine lactone hydrolase
MELTLRGLNLGNFGLDMSALLEAPEYHGIPYACPALAYIIEHPEGRILFETGLSEHALEEWPEEWQSGVDLAMVPLEHKLEARLKEHGLGPEDFDYVVLGHLHTDHAGGARVFADADVEMVVHEDEYNYVRNMPEDAANFFNKVDTQVLEHCSKTLVSDADFEILPGVRLVHLPGHTPGLMGVVIDLPHTGTVMLTTDAMYRHESYGPPPIGSPTVWDTAKWAQSIEKIRSMALATEAMIFPGHDNEAVKQFATHTELRQIGFMPGHHYG